MERKHPQSVNDDEKFDATRKEDSLDFPEEDSSFLSEVRSSNMEQNVPHPLINEEKCKVTSKKESLDSSDDESTTPMKDCCTIISKNCSVESSKENIETDTVVHCEKSESIAHTMEHSESKSQDSLSLEKDSNTCYTSTEKLLESDSASITPSPDPHSGTRSFDYPDSGLSAALRAEKEFLSFMFKLPPSKQPVAFKKARTDTDVKLKEDRNLPKNAQVVPNASHVGLNQLDNLCKMMEQLRELREQNTRLQKRVQYLEEMKLLQELHKEMETPRFKSSLTGINLSDIDFRLEELPETFHLAEESEHSDSSISEILLELKEQLLDLPVDELIHASSEEEIKCDAKESEPKDILKLRNEKKPRKSTWGKVKNIISYKKENVSKKPQSAKRPRLPHSMSTTSSDVPKDFSGSRPVSDPEDYDRDPYDVDTSCEWDKEISEGIWMKVKKKENMQSPHDAYKKKKPHLTITVPSNEDLSMQTNSEDGMTQINVGKISPADSSGSSKIIDKTSPELSSPLSPRRTSQWSKVKQAFLTSHSQISRQAGSKLKTLGYSSPPSSPAKNVKDSTFNFDGTAIKQDIAMEESDSNSGLSPELSPEGFSPKNEPSPTEMFPGSTEVPRNLVELQRNITDEFSKKITEWEKRKNPVESRRKHRPRTVAQLQSRDKFPVMEFKKKRSEWEKQKKERPSILLNPSLHQATLHKDFKIRNYKEETLPPDFKKKLAEWQIRKALVGKGEQDVEQIQKNLGEDFNKKIAQWQRMKARAKAVDGELGESALHSYVKHRTFPVSAKLTNLAEAAAILPVLDRKGSGQKEKKLKGKHDTKTDSVHKHRNKELQWLEKELGKIEREKQRLEREKDKFLEREARLEKMRNSMKERQPEKKEIYIKTSTGEFRFEGISQTFTKKLYEWEERRGIRPESSTFILLDPNYRAPSSAEEKPRTPDPKRLVRSRSESSIAELAQNEPSPSHQSTISLNTEMDESQHIHVENKSASEPMLLSCETKSSLYRPETPVEPSLEEHDETIESREDNDPLKFAYEHEEITRLIDSSTSENENLSKDDERVLVRSHGSVRRTESVKSEEDYQNLMDENMSLLMSLTETENVCLALKSQIGDIDTKMDSVTDQHLKTLEKLHRQIHKMKKIESFVKDPLVHECSELVENEQNRSLINQLQERIAELEEKGDKLMRDKEQLECSFNLHKNQENLITESLMVRIRELQDAGAEVNIQTVQCQNNDVSHIESHETSDEPKIILDHQEGSCKKKRRRRKDSKSDQRRSRIAESDEECMDRKSKEMKEGKRKKKVPTKSIQRLHSLTADLLFQAKRLEQGLIAKHDAKDISDPQKVLSRNRSLKTQRSLRIANEKNQLRKATKKEYKSGRNWSSIEAIGSEGNDVMESKAAAIMFESQDLLEMNSELTRMARELRKEMTNIWNFKESTSESNSSDTRADLLEATKDRALKNLENGDRILDEEERLLAEKTEQVLKDIASLKRGNWSSRDASPAEETSSSAKKDALNSTSDDIISLDASVNANRESSNSLIEVQRRMDNVQESYDDENIDKFENDEVFIKFRSLSSSRSIDLNGNREEFYGILEHSTSLSSHDSYEFTQDNGLKQDRPFSRDTGFSSENRIYDEAECIAASSLEYDKSLTFEADDKSEHDFWKIDNDYKLISNQSFNYDDSQEEQRCLDILPPENYYEQNETNDSKRYEVTCRKTYDRQGSLKRKRRSKCSTTSPYETEIRNYEELALHNDLRMRRISDTQVDYLESDLDVKSQVEKLKNDSYMRRNHSENNVILLEDIENGNSIGNAILETKRGIFTLDTDDPSSTKGSFQFMVPDDREDRNRAEKRKSDHETNIKVNTFENFPTFVLGESELGKPDTTPKSSSKESSPTSVSTVVHCGSPPEYSNVSKKFRSDGERQYAVKTMLDLFNNRITRNQQLLLNPFTMNDPFIEIKRKQTMSSNDIDLFKTEASISKFLDEQGLLRYNKTSNLVVFPTPTSSCTTSLSVDQSNGTFGRKYDYSNSNISSSSIEEDQKIRTEKLREAREQFLKGYICSQSQRKLANNHLSQPSTSYSAYAINNTAKPHENRPSYYDTSWAPPKPPRASFVTEPDFTDCEITTAPAKQKSPAKTTSQETFTQKIMHFFRKDKKKKSSAVETLCRQSLQIDLNCQVDNGLELIPDSPNLRNYEFSHTIPRGACALTPSHSSHSCPSTPVSPPKSKRTKWLHLLKRTPSPKQKK